MLVTSYRLYHSIRRNEPHNNFPDRMSTKCHSLISDVPNTYTILCKCNTHYGTTTCLCIAFPVHRSNSSSSSACPKIFKRTKRILYNSCDSSTHRREKSVL